LVLESNIKTKCKGTTSNVAIYKPIKLKYEIKNNILKIFYKYY